MFVVVSWTNARNENTVELVNIFQDLTDAKEYAYSYYIRNFADKIQDGEEILTADVRRGRWKDEFVHTEYRDDMMMDLDDSFVHIQNAVYHVGAGMDSMVMENSFIVSVVFLQPH